MKKFIIACTAVIIAVTCWMFVSDRIGSTLSFNMNKEVKTFTTVSDKEILVDTGNGMEPFEIRGVDMGVGIPGHFATDYAIDKETYLRWFRMIKDMGANCVRVYTLLQDDFYDAVWEFNHDNPDPLYIIHGVWIDDYVLYSHRDAYSKDFLNEFLRDSRILVDMIHGNKRFSLGEDLGSGSYTKDISPWVLGYILGVEWEDTTVAFTDHMQEERDSYEGKYMRTTEEALKAIPDSYREGSYGLGAGKLRTVFAVVLPSAVPGILAGVILSIGRIVGETAALIYTAGTVAALPDGVLSSGRTLAVHMYVLASEGLYMKQAYATAVILVVIVVAINALSSRLAKQLMKGK